MALLDALYEAAPVGLAFHDRDLRFVRINRALAAINGVGPEAHLGRTPAEVIPGLDDQVTPQLRRVLETGQPVLDVEVGGPSPASPGERGDWLASYYPVRSPGGELLGVGGVVVDMTQRRRMESQLQAAKEAAEAANRAKDRFLAVLSHELRTPLTPVLMAATALLDRARATPREVRPTLEMIRRNVELEARLIDDLLDLTRIEPGQAPAGLRRSSTCHDPIGQALRHLPRRDRRPTGLRWSWTWAPRRHHVEADPARLQQVLWNLIKNAVKFTPAGGTIAVRTRNAAAAVRRPDRAGRRGRRHRHRHRAGGPAADLRRLRAGRGRDSRGSFGGLGLGLAISRSLAEAHGGTLTAASARARAGADLPPGAADGARPAAGPRGPGTSGRPAAPSGAAHPRWSRTTRTRSEYIALVLRGCGHEVRDGRAARRGAGGGGGGEFDLLVSDIELPDGTGLELMRPAAGGAGCRAIAMSGYGTEEDIRRSREAGFAEHLTKPVDFRRLEEAIRRVSAKAGVGCRPRPPPPREDRVRSDRRRAGARVGRGRSISGRATPRGPKAGPHQLHDDLAGGIEHASARAQTRGMDGAARGRGVALHRRLLGRPHRAFGGPRRLAIPGTPAERR